MLLYRGYTVHNCFCNSTIRFTCWNLILVFKYHYVLQLLGITQRNSSNAWEGNVIEQFNCASDLWHPLRIQKCINYLLFIHIPLRLPYNNTHSHLNQMSFCGKAKKQTNSCPQSYKSVYGLEV